MKKAIMALAILAAVSGGAITSAHAAPGKKGKKHTTTTKYTCSMHPEVVVDKPGKCPKCGMDLVAVKSRTKSKTK